MVHVEAPQRGRSGDLPEAGTGRGTDGARTDIDVRVGADAETVSVQIHASHATHCGGHLHAAVSDAAALIAPLTAAEAAALRLPVPKNMVQAIRVAPSLSGADVGSSAALRMVVTVPSRFCGVSVNQSGSGSVGHISVGPIKEAALHVTGGTSVHVGGVSGTEVVVRTDGPVTGSASAGRIRMRGASLALKKVQSLDARLEAADGDIAADAVYARRFRAIPGRRGGNCAIGTLNCDEAAVIDLQDGDVRIDGLDGRASVLKRRQDPKARTVRSSVNVQLSDGVRSFQVLSYVGDLRRGGAAEDIDVECYLPPDVELQARLNAGTVTVHEPVVFAVSGCLTGTCRTGVLHSSGHAQSPSSGESAGSGEVPGSRGGATPVNVADPVNGESGGGVDGTGAAGPVGATEKAAACGMRLKTVLQVNLQAGPNGRIDIKTRSWMDGLRARMRERDQS